MRHLFAVLLAATVLTAPAMAQTVTGSGIAPATVDNSAERPFRFAEAAPTTGALVIMTDGATVPANTPVDAATRAALEQAIAVW